MLLFPAYSIFVWYLCVRFRRTIWGFLALACGVLGVITLTMVQRRVRDAIGMEPTPFSNLDFLLWIESVAVLVVGLFLTCLPAHRCHLPCRNCSYELDGLEDDNPTCPECGLQNAARKLKRSRCAQCGDRALMDPARHRCPACLARDESPAALQAPHRVQPGATPSTSHAA